MMRKVLLMFLVIGLFASPGVLAAYGSSFNNPSSNWQSYQPTFDRLYSGDFSNYWPILNDMRDGQCNATTDFVIGIPPGGCSPAVVTSDLLAEQNVPVFCQLYAIKVNPLIKVSSIRSISFKGDYPEGVRSVVYHPARAAVKSYRTLLGAPTLENIGYVVIILKQEKVEANMEEWISGNLTATMRYDAEEAYGVGKGEYYLEEMSDRDWAQHYMESSFWRGRGFLRVSDIENGQAKIQVMADKDRVLRTLTLKEGETSSSSYLPGFYCKAGLKVKLTDITTQEDMARLNVDGEDIWVRDGTSFLDGKCRVKSLDVRGNNDGDISIYCSGAGNVKALSLTGARARFRIGGEEETVKLGGEINDSDWHLAYVGNYPKGFNENKNEIAILVKDSEDRDAAEFSAAVAGLNLETGTEEDFEDKVLSAVRIITRDEKREAFVIEKDEKIKGITFLGVDNALKDFKNENSYFDRSVDVVVDELVGEYGSEEKDIGGTWGEDALYEEIVLAGEIGKFATQKHLMDLFLDEYPLAKSAPYVQRMRERAGSTDYTESYVSVYVGNEFKSISVVDFKAAGEGGKSVDLRVGTIPYNGLREKGGDDFNKTVNGISLAGSGNLTIDDISVGKIRVIFKTGIKNPRGDDRSWSGWISEGDSRVFAGRTVYVSNINIKRVAHVSLIPDVKHEKSEADFSFRIGIEKRAIELSPEKATRMIEDLNVTIEKWEGIVERLGNVVTGLKGACFATSAVLMIKNFASGVSGAAAARTKVMEEFRERCDTEERLRDMSRTACYNELSSEIEASVAATAGYYVAVNADMEAAQEGTIEDSGGLIGGKAVVNNAKYRDNLANKIGGDSVQINISNKKQEGVDVDGNLSVSQLQSIMLWKRAVAGGDEASIKVAKREMDASLRNVALAAEQKKKNDAAARDLEKLGLSGAKVQSYTSKDVKVLKWDGDFAKDGKTKIQILNVDGKNYRLVLHDSGSENMAVEEAGLCSADCGNEASWKDQLGDNDGYLDKEFRKIVFSSVSGESCSNAWTTKNQQVKYYDIGDNKGLPAIVPFGFPGRDLDDGWYVWVKNSGGGFLDDSVQGYRASGDVRNFYVCNIGPNGVMQTGTGDDLCQNFDANSVGSINTFKPCPEIDVNRIYDRAREAIRQASRQYGERSINIFDKMIDVGQPMSALGGFECQNFMSAKDCKLMFNVCDPVICPPSRCDLGGKFPVSDVIQTGIIGSLTLCLPNAQDGILLPVCLSGVHAGLDSYVSILKSEKDCLETNLENGELVGICDQITSVYKCEFFWRQMSPLMDQLIPGVLDFVAGGGSKARGGGEYALVSQAWETTKQSVSFFKNTYAQNAFRAFNVRGTQEAGSSFCKAFIGTSVPGSASFIEDLLAPESPVQFYAQFSEKTFTEATVPATSHYKVYFHIYAGNDQGVQYKVYLRDPPATSYYATNPEISDSRMSGYIAAGSSADKSVDFTAPSGYKELCVVINAQEECGFKQVTSSFGLDYLRKKAVEEQAVEENIQTEKECISGSPSALSLASLNLAAGADEVLNPEISMRGIVRICATGNPDSGIVSENVVTCVDDSNCNSRGFECSEEGKCVDKAGSGTFQTSIGRWKDVGYCGNVNLRCWLDIASVENDLEALEAIDGASISVLDERRGLINNTRLDLEGVAKLLSKARGDIDKLLGIRDIDKAEEEGERIASMLDKVIGTNDAAGAGTNNDRAEALALKASVWRLLVGKIVRDTVDEELEEVVVTGTRIPRPNDEKEKKVEEEEAKTPSSREKTLLEVMTERDDCDCGDKCLEYSENIMEYSEEYSIDDPLRVLAIMIQESGCKYDVISGAGSYGLMQIEGKSFEDICKGELKSGNDGDFSQIKINPSRTEQNIECGIKILRKKYDDYSNGVEESWAWKTAPSQGGFGNEVRACIENAEFGYLDYGSWKAAERGYNGWGCEGGADVDYVEKVEDIFLELKEEEAEGVDEGDTGGAEEVVEFEVFWREGEGVFDYDDTIRFKWNSAEGKVEAEVRTRGFLAFRYKMVCDWGVDCSDSEEMTKEEIEMYNDILSQKTWDDAVSVAKGYEEELSKIDSGINYYK